MKRAIVMLSLGNRPWSEAAFRTFELYGKKYDAEAFYIGEDIWQDSPELSDLPENVGRSNKKAYALKSYLSWKYLSEGYNQVLIVDDACVVHSGSRNIFRFTGENTICAAGTSSHHAKRSFDHIKRVLPGVLNIGIYFNVDDYVNSGVVLYNNVFPDTFSPDRILRARHLLTANYPHQTLLYFLMKFGKVKLNKISKRYNYLIGHDLTKEKRRNLESLDNVLDFKDFDIGHITGGYKNRALLLDELTCAALNTWNRQAEARNEEGFQTHRIDKIRQ